MAESLRDQLKASMEKLEKDRVEVLKVDEKVFGSSPELEQIKEEAREEKEERLEPKREEHIEQEPKDPIQEHHQEPEQEKEAEALAHWPEEKRKTFQNLSKEAKEFVLEREKNFNSDYTKKTQKHAEELRIAEKYKQALSPHEDYLRSIGMDPMDAATNLIAFERRLANASPKEKAQIIRQLADQYKADFTDESEEPVDPKISRLESKVLEQENYLRRIDQERKEAKEYEIQRTINDFKNTKDSSGRPKYPHFESVMQDMGDFIETAERRGKHITMESAYESAIMLNNELRQEYISNYNKDRFREEDNKKRLSVSKNASFNVKSTGSDSKESPRNLSIREALIRSMNDANAYS